MEVTKRIKPKRKPSENPELKEVKPEHPQKTPDFNLDNLSFLEMGILFYLKNYGLRKVPEEKRQGLMRARFDEAEKKLKALGFIEE